MNVPDKMPDDVPHDPHYFVDACMTALGETMHRFDGALSRAERLGVLEMFKLRLVQEWQKETDDE